MNSPFFFPFSFFFLVPTLNLCLFLESVLFVYCFKSVLFSFSENRFESKIQPPLKEFKLGETVEVVWLEKWRREKYNKKWLNISLSRAINEGITLTMPCRQKVSNDTTEPYYVCLKWQDLLEVSK